MREPRGITGGTTVSMASGLRCSVPAVLFREAESAETLLVHAP
jgi:hypothetical protein